ncbi:hypothetical protein V2J09_010759, partial [Rumex salicifolius]
GDRSLGNQVDLDIDFLTTRKEGKALSGYLRSIKPDGSVERYKERVMTKECYLSFQPSRDGMPINWTSLASRGQLVVVKPDGSLKRKSTRSLLKDTYWLVVVKFVCYKEICMDSNKPPDNGMLS